MKAQHTARTLPALLALALAACGGGEAAQETADDLSDDIFFYCGESRGALLAARWMSEGREPVDTTELSVGDWAFRQLADRVEPPAGIREDFDRWRSAIETWHERRSAIPPTIVDGLLIEPDLTELDQSLLGEIAPLRERIGRWVDDVCGNPLPVELP